MTSRAARPVGRGPVTDVVVVPGAPLLLPEYQGRTSADAGLGTACLAAVRAAVATASHVVVVHATDREPRSTKPPVGRRVADVLLAASPLAASPLHVEHVAVAWDAPVADCVALGRALAGGPGDGSAEGRGTTLLVVADGSARRTEKAPGHLDPRAAAVDDALVDAVRASAEGGLQRLLDLDPDLCAALLVAGRAPLQVLAGAVEDVPLTVASLEVSDPFGVLYVVAHLSRRPT